MHFLEYMFKSTGKRRIIELEETVSIVQRGNNWIGTSLLDVWNNEEILGIIRSQEINLIQNRDSNLGPPDF